MLVSASCAVSEVTFSVGAPLARASDERAMANPASRVVTAWQIACTRIGILSLAPL